MEQTKIKKGKKSRIVIINHEEEDEPGQLASESQPLIPPTEFESSNVNTSEVLSSNASPSAPPEEEFQPVGLANVDIRRKFLQKVYGVLMAQYGVFAVLTALFAYIPHLRKIVRKLFFDKMLFSPTMSLVTFGIIVLLICFPSLRRRYAKITMGILTLSLSLLLSYAINVNTANACLFSILSTETCFGGIVGLSLKKGVDFTSWKALPMVPLFMVAANCLSPSIMNIPLKSAIFPSIVTTLVTSYLTCNTRPVIRFNELDLEPQDYVFAASQLYLHPGHKILSFLSSTRRRRSLYNTI